MWGPYGVMIYNDAYAAICGARHPSLLGMPVCEAWPEAADFNGACSIRRCSATTARSKACSRPSSKSPNRCWRSAREAYEEELQRVNRVLLTSGHAIDRSLFDGSIAGEVELLPKPYLLPQLAQAVRHELERRRVRQPADAHAGALASMQAVSFLVVDDDRDTRELVCELLNALGHPRSRPTARKPRSACCACRASTCCSRT